MNTVGRIVPSFSIQIQLFETHILRPLRLISSLQFVARKRGNAMIIWVQCSYTLHTALISAFGYFYG